MRVEVTEAEQPYLFAFIRQLCQDTGAPFPHRVFLSPDVNAAVVVRGVAPEPRLSRRGRTCSSAWGWSTAST